MFQSPLGKDRYFRLERAGRYVGMLESLIYSDREDISGVRFTYGDFTGPQDPGFDDSSWQVIDRNFRYGGHFISHWFRVKATVPERFSGKPVRLVLHTSSKTVWDYANPNFILYIDGHCEGAFDGCHFDFLLTKSAEAGKEYCLAFKGWSEGDGENSEFILSMQTYCPETEAAMYDLKAPVAALSCMEQNSLTRQKLAPILSDAVNLLDLSEPYSPAYYSSVKAFRDFLEKDLYGVYNIDNGLEGSVIAVGHSHIDVAWKWPMSQTHEKAVRTFTNMLSLMREYPEFTFMMSQPQLYQFVKDDCPESYARIRQAVKEGRWEAEGGMWLECDCNLTSGEGLVRQFIYGKRFYKQEFGVDSRILWLPDVFGYSAALPQILKKCDMEYFMTTKISWSEYNPQPYDTFIWQGMDGSEVFAHFIPIALLDIVKNPAKKWTRSSYGADSSPEWIMGGRELYKQKDICDEVLAALGAGDGGGGTLRSTLEMARRLEKGIPGVPRFKWGTVTEYFDKWSQKLKGNRFLPKWVGELYLEYHRGTLTSIAKNKRNNRKSELLYMKDELLSVIDMLLNNGAYPAEELRANWQKILTLQFHDILPGSSVKEVYDDSDREYAGIFDAGNQIANEKYAALAGNIQIEAPSVVVFNDTGFTVTETAELPDEDLHGKALLCPDGTVSPLQKTASGYIFTARRLLPKGWARFPIIEAPDAQEAAVTASFNYSTGILDSPFFRVALEPDGTFSSVYDKRAGREALTRGGRANRIMAYEDKPWTADAWNIYHYTYEKGYPMDNITKVTLTENGPVRAVLRVERTFMSSIIHQDIVFYAELPRIDFQTFIDWKEDELFVKTHFDLDINADHAVYDIQFGNMERPNHYSTTWDFAKFEVCGHKWADLGQDGYGVALLNDCKYGYACNGTDFSLSLIKCAIDPNPSGDREQHYFTYSLMPHASSWKEAGVVPAAFGLNCPPAAYVRPSSAGCLPADFSFVSCDCDNIVVETVKKGEECDDIILRLYDVYNRTADAVLTFGLPLSSAEICDMLESTTYQPLDVNGNCLRLTVKPFEIVTLKLRFVAERGNL